jgi:negative regulator of replication initiation
LCVTLWPKAWGQIIADEDELLLEILADRVESLCGFKPGPDMVARFLKEGVAARVAAPIRNHAQDVPKKSSAAPSIEILTAPSAPAVNTRLLGFTFKGAFHPSRNAIDALRQVFELLSARDPTFAERFASLPKHGRSRRYLAKEAADLYPGRPDLARDCATQLSTGWWLGTNHSKQTIGRIIWMACEVADMVPGSDLVAHLGD